MAEASLARSRPSWGTTDRRDAWWAGPLTTFAVLTAFVVYATVRALMNADFHHLPTDLLSPFYSPNVGEWTPLPNWLSPAIVILWAPAGFRLTCYYYRKAYYRAFTQHPPACGVAEGHRGEYCGETRFPLILQNLHRYLLYVALAVLVFLWHDVWRALWPDGELGVTLGTVVLATNSALLTCYTLGCHSFRHLIGGKLDRFSGSGLVQIRHKGWKGVTRLNERHMLFAWTSLFAVMIADFYVWMVAAGHLTNWRLL
jgi:hypothetical protein